MCSVGSCADPGEEGKLPRAADADEDWGDASDEDDDRLGGKAGDAMHDDWEMADGRGNNKQVKVGVLGGDGKERSQRVLDDTQVGLLDGASSVSRGSVGIDAEFD